MLAVVLAVSSARWVLAAGAALQILVLVGYVVVASERTPAYEAWGITSKVLQVLLLAALVYLATQRPGRTTKRSTEDPTRSAA